MSILLPLSIWCFDDQFVSRHCIRQRKSCHRLLLIFEEKWYPLLRHHTNWRTCWWWWQRWFHNCLTEYFQLKDSLKGLFFSCFYTKTAILKSPLVVSFSLYTSLFFKFLQFHDKSWRAILVVLFAVVADSLLVPSPLDGKRMKTPFGANDVTFWSKGNLRQSLYKNLTRGLNLMLISS